MPLSEQAPTALYVKESMKICRVGISQDHFGVHTNAEIFVDAYSTTVTYCSEEIVY